MPFYLLIDYDNISTPDQTRGLTYIIEKILSKLSPNEVNDRNITARLYGGWYESNSITRKAQNLNIEIGSDFPRPISLSDQQTQVIVRVELAMSLQVAPSAQLFNTFRRRGIPSGLHSNHPNTIGCQQIDCQIVHVHNFLRTGICSQCTLIRTDDIFYRQEQKLVDTMLTSDMITIAQIEHKLAIISSDDDFWPGILTSVTQGSKIYHFHTKPGRTTPTHYRRTVNQNYSMKSL